MFIFSQNKLINELEEKLQDEELVISKAWTWTELIPLWGMIAIYMSFSKIEENVSIYRMRSGVEVYFNKNYALLYLITSIISFVIPFAGIVVLIILLLAWIEISTLSKKISRSHYTTEFIDNNDEEMNQ